MTAIWAHALWVLRDALDRRMLWFLPFYLGLLLLILTIDPSREAGDRFLYLLAATRELGGLAICVVLIALGGWSLPREWEQGVARLYLVAPRRRPGIVLGRLLGLGLLGLGLSLSAWLIDAAVLRAAAPTGRDGAYALEGLRPFGANSETGAMIWRMDRAVGLDCEGLRLLAHVESDEPGLRRTEAELVIRPEEAPPVRHRLRVTEGRALNLPLSREDRLRPFAVELRPLEPDVALGLSREPWGGWSEGNGLWLLRRRSDLAQNLLLSHLLMALQAWMFAAVALTAACLGGGPVAIALAAAFLGISSARPTIEDGLELMRSRRLHPLPLRAQGDPSAPAEIEGAGHVHGPETGLPPEALSAAAERLGRAVLRVIPDPKVFQPDEALRQGRALDGHDLVPALATSGLFLLGGLLLGGAFLWRREA